MLWTVFIILLVLWALGFGFVGASAGGFIHILLVIAVFVLAVQLLTGRRVAQVTPLAKKGESVLSRES